MRWVKHLSMAHKDAEMDAVLEKHGAIVYGVYWLIVEEIASVMEKGKMLPEATHSVSKWASICHVPPRSLRQMLVTLSSHLIHSCVTSDQRVKITVPNILKYKDEYAKKSGQAPDSKADTETHTETETETDSGMSGSRLGYPAGSEGWDELCEAAVKARMSFDPSPQSAFCLKVWCKLDMETKRAIIESIRKRIDCGEFGPDIDPRYIPKLDNYINGGRYRHSLQPRNSLQVIGGKRDSMAEARAYAKAQTEKRVAS